MVCSPAPHRGRGTLACPLTSAARVSFDPLKQGASARVSTVVGFFVVAISNCLVRRCFETVSVLCILRLCIGVDS